MTYLGLQNELVLRRHLALLLDEVVDSRSVKTSVLSNNLTISLSLNLLDHLLLLNLVLSLTSSNNLLLFNLLDTVGTFKVHDTVQVQSCLDLDTSEITVGGLFDILDGEFTEPWVDSLGDVGGFIVSCLELEWTLSVESQDLGRRDGVSDREDD
jgi:hypothetical protein